MDRGRSALTGGEQAAHDLVLALLVDRQHLAHVVGRDAAHVVVHGRQHGDRLLGDVDAGKDLGGLGDAGQALGQRRRAEMRQLQVDVVLLGTDAAALHDLDRHRARDDVARREVLGGRRVALHEALALGVEQNASLAARALGDQAAGAVDAGRVELHELDVLLRNAGARRHGVAVAGARVRAGARKVRATEAAGGEDCVVRAEAMDATVLEAQGNHTTAFI